MTTNPDSRKTLNLLSNPRVSILVHDWVSHRPPTCDPNPSGGGGGGGDGHGDGSPPPPTNRSSLANLLMNFNTSALSSISTTITGTARFLEPGSEEESWCKKQHLDSNTFEAQLGSSGGRRQPGVRRSSLTIDENARVFAVGVCEGRIADWKGSVRDWVVVAEGQDSASDLVNGVGP